MPSKELTIMNKLGLHARPAAMFVKVANQYSADVWVEKDGDQASGKSIMNLMLMAIRHGDKILISAEGDDSNDVLTALETLVTKEFLEMEL